MYLQSVSMMPKGIFYADLRLANYLYFEVPLSEIQLFQYKWEKIQKVYQ